MQYRRQRPLTMER